MIKGYSITTIALGGTMILVGAATLTMGILSLLGSGEVY